MTHSTEELVKALEFYAWVGLYFDHPDLKKDSGKIARDALTAHRAKNETAGELLSPRSQHADVIRLLIEKNIKDAVIAKDMIDRLNNSLIQAATRKESVEVVTVQSLVDGFVDQNDKEDYPFKGEEYDIELVTYAFNWLLNRQPANGLKIVEGEGE